MLPEPGVVVGSSAVAATFFLLLGRRANQWQGTAVILGCAVLPLVLIFVLNPGFRIFSRHGLFHASMLYQILGGGIPPNSPLAAGGLLHFHWAYNLVGALVSWVSGLPPSWSFGAINIAAFVVVLLALGRVSIPLFGDSSQRLLGPMVAIFAITPISLWWVEGLGFTSTHIGHLMARGTPVFQKFANTNGASLGMVCVALAVLAIRIDRTGPLARFAGVSASIASCGLIYPPLLPSALVIVTVFSAVEHLSVRGEDGSLLWRAAAVDIGALVTGLGLAFTGLVALDSFPNASAAVLEKPYLVADVLSLLLTVLPLVIVIGVAWKRLRIQADHLLVNQLLCAAAANAGCFLGLALTDRNEYKFLIACQLLLGLVGGAALAALHDRFGIAVAGTLAVLFMGSFVGIFSDYFVIHRDAGNQLKEIGRRLVHSDPEQNRLYEWIGVNTPPDGAFVDSDNLLMVLGPRAVVLPYRRSPGNPRPELGRGRGFFHRMDRFVERAQRLQPDQAARRRKLVQVLLDGGENDVGRGRTLLNKLGISPVYVVCRTPEQHRRMDQIGAAEIYRDDAGGLSVMRWSSTAED